MINTEFKLLGLQAANLNVKKNHQGKKLNKIYIKKPYMKNGSQWILQLNNLSENIFNHNFASQVVLNNYSNSFKSQQSQTAPTGYAKQSFQIYSFPNNWFQF